MIPVLAVDPSLRATAWATVTSNGDGDRLHHGIIESRVHNGQRWRTLNGAERLAYIAGKLRAEAKKHGAMFLAIEGYSHGSTYNGHTLGELGGVIRTVMWGAGYPYIEVAPKTVKMWAANNGNADKRAMLAAAKDLCGYRGNSHDEADAILLHAAVADALGQAWAIPEHDRRDQALAPVVAALGGIEILQAPH